VFQSNGMAHFKFLLDRSVKSLTPCFPDKRVETTESIGLPDDAPDETIVAEASTGKFLLVAANRCDFRECVRNYVAQSSKKPMGCHAVNGMVLLIPNERHVQEKILKNLESKLFFEGRKITYKDVHDRELLVQVESDGTPRVERLPRCRHCGQDD
jgi:hypothetical protein